MHGRPHQCGNGYDWLISVTDAFSTNPISADQCGNNFDWLDSRYIFLNLNIFDLIDGKEKDLGKKYSGGDSLMGVRL